jgi:hypothetical protein
MLPSDAVSAEFTSALPLGDFAGVLLALLLLPPPPQAAIKSAAPTAMEAKIESLIRYLL